MADTKKPNFAEALKAQAKPAAASSADESVVVDLGDGQPTTLYRGKGSTRMDDAQWARLKQRAVKALPAKAGSGGDAESEAFAAKAGTQAQAEANKLSAARSSSADAADSRRQALLDLVNNPHFQPGKDSIVPDKDTLDIVRKMKPSDQADYLEKRVQHQEWQQQQEVDRSKKMSEKDQPPATDTGVTKPDQGTPDEWKPPFTPPGSQGLQTEDDVKLGMGANPRNPASMIPQLAMGAIDPNGKSPTGDPNADKYTQAAIDKGNATGASDLAAVQQFAGKAANAAAAGKSAQDAASPGAMIKDQIDQRVFGDQPLIPDALKQLPQAAGAGMATDLGTLGQVAGDALGMPNLAQAGANLSNRAQMPPAYGGAAEPMNPEGAMPPGMPPAPAQMPPVPPPGAGGGASMSMQIPGGFSPVGADPAAMKQYREDAANARAAAEDAQFSIKAQGEAQTEAVRQAAARQMEVEAQTNNLARLASEAKLTSVAEARRYQTAQMTVAEQARQAAATPTDPNRFWNNKSDGQKAAAVIAGALFGFSGHGEQWLQRIDGLVNADNQLQAQDRASKVQGLQQQAQTLGEAGRMAIANGATEAEAFIIERQAKLEGLKSYLDMTGMRLQNAQQQQQAALMSATLGQHIADLGAQGATLAQHQADSTNQARYQNASLQMEKFKIAATMAGNGGGDKLNPQAQTTISQAEAGLGMIPELERAIGNPGGKISTALFDQISKQFPGTDANNRDIQAAFLNRTIFAGIDKSVINAADQTFLDKLQASPGLSSLRAPGAIAALKRMLTLSRNAAIQTARSVGQRTGDLQLSPDTGAASPINFTPSAR